MDEHIRSVMAAVFKVSVETITENASQETIATWDSLKHMNLVLALEDEFGVEFTEEEILEMIDYRVVRHILAKKRATA